ncbi:hypothetical protein [Caulobacter phage Cr30]|uniref:hypothetical protein n=1 Tax=Caulobacter phage Cr30 TaxID=1357714 RepID=UPI0004A9B974|nr:hypothetical protein OZ74_gp266 [Caulobacter phage Cr30]AGS81077.1 hypothetical protein [Caulobacter phage Cr30]
MLEVGKKYRYSFDGDILEFEVTYIQDTVIVFKYTKNTVNQDRLGFSDTCSSESHMAENSVEIVDTSKIVKTEQDLTITREPDEFIDYGRSLQLSVREIVPDDISEAVKFA